MTAPGKRALAQLVAAGEYTEQAITGALAQCADAIGLHNQRPGTLGPDDGHRPVVRFDIGESIQGGVGTYRDGEYLICLGYRLLNDEGGGYSRHTMSAGSAKVAAAADIPSSLTDLTETARQRYAEVE